jgi:uncharacterized protein YndB with AHSA1/START domain
MIRAVTVIMQPGGGILVPDKIEKRIELKAPVARVWRALTDYHEFGEWFRVALTEPFLVGTTVRGNILHPGYEHVVWEVKVEEMIEEKLFSFTWAQPKSLAKEHYKPDYTGEPRTLVEFRLQPTATGTLLTVTESGFSKLPDDRREQNYKGNDGGWAQQMTNIKVYLGEHA